MLYAKKIENKKYIGAVYGDSVWDSIGNRGYSPVDRPTNKKVILHEQFLLMEWKYQDYQTPDLKLGDKTYEIIGFIPEKPGVKVVLPYNKGVYTKGVYEMEIHSSILGEVAVVDLQSRLEVKEISWEMIQQFQDNSYFKSRKFGKEVMDHYGIPYHGCGWFTEGTTLKSIDDQFMIISVRGGTGKTDHTINPPEEITYGHEYVDREYKISRGGGWGLFSEEKHIIYV